MRLLLDGDIIAYSMACAVEGNQGDSLDLQESIADMVARWTRIDPEQEADIVIALSKGRSFRYDTYPGYKKHRQDQPDPLYRAEAMQILRDEYYCADQDKLEGDDILGILSTEKPNQSVIVSIDKDLRQIPGYYFNPQKMEKAEYIDPGQALFNFHMQWLMGDPGDGYPGIPKVGPVKAGNFLKAFWIQDPNPEKGDSYYDHEAAETAIEALYLNKNLTVEYCTQMWQCAKILRWGDWLQDIPIC